MLEEHRRKENWHLAGRSGRHIKEAAFKLGLKRLKSFCRRERMERVFQAEGVA